MATPNRVLAIAEARDATVLLADVIGIGKLYDLKALEAIARCRNSLQDTIQAEGGRIVRTMGERIMALFRTPDAAALAAARMQVAVEALPSHEAVKLAIRIAFHSGAVTQRESEVFGETVDITAKILAQALKAQTLTYETTANTLSPLVRNCLRHFHDAGDAFGGAQPLWELAWRQSPDITDATGIATSARRPQAVLRLVYRGQTLVRRRGNEAVRVGREEHCEIFVSDRKVSRQQCTIERKGDSFILRDHSTNGTYVTRAGEREMLLLGDEVSLEGSGIIALGQSSAERAEVIEYHCAKETG
jgi:adenylate cyclase